MHVFMWQSLEVLNVFNTLTLKQISGKRKAFPKNWSTVFKFKPLRLKAHHFHAKMLCQKPMLRQTEWRLQNEPTTKNGVLPVTTSQQTFIFDEDVLKTHWRRLLPLSSEDVFKTSWSRWTYSPQSCIFKTSSRRLGQDQYIRLGYTSSRRLQEVFKTSSRRLRKTSSRHLQEKFQENSHPSNSPWKI